MGAAWLVRDALDSQSNPVPLELRPTVWGILDLLSEDPDPDPKKDEDRDWHSVALNSVRPVALSAVIQFALWVGEGHRSDVTGSDNVTGFALVPEARDKLERHLDPEFESSPAVWSMFGRWFPYLARLDRMWAIDRRHQFFPQAEELANLYVAAWEAHVFFNRIFPWMFSLLKREYEAAVERIGAARPDGREPMTDPDQQLAQHLMTFYWSGVMGELQDATMLRRWYEKAPASLRSHMVWYVGAALGHEKEQVAEEYLAPIRELWEWRVDEARKSTDAAAFEEELSRFGWWCRDNGFSDDWLFAQLKEVLRLVGQIDPDYMVVEYLAGKAHARPGDCVVCLKLMLMGEGAKYDIQGSTEEAKTIFAAAIGSDEDDARSQAIELINWLGARGHWSFRQLLPD